VGIAESPTPTPIFGELRPDNEINQNPFSSFSSDLLLTIEVISESTSPKPNEL